MSELIHSAIFRTGDLVFIELMDTRTDANIVVNNVIRKLIIPDEELKPVLPKVRACLYDLGYQGHPTHRAILSEAKIPNYIDIIAAETQVFLWKVLNSSRLVVLPWQ